MTEPLPSSCDAVVVGARCAGAATAMLLARRGMRVLALDRHDYGADTLSTHALMRGGVVQLHRWGLLGALAAAGTPPVTATVFHYGGDEVAVPIKPGSGVDALYAPRRTLLDRVLVDAARAAGAEVRHGVPAVGLLRSRDGRVEGAVARLSGGGTVEVRAGLVIGADGLRSAVARLADAPLRREGRHAAAAIYGYFGGLDRDRYHWHYGEGVAASVIPTDDGAANVCLSMPPSRFLAEIREPPRARFLRGLGEVSAELARAVGEAPQLGPFRAFAGARGLIRRPFGPGWALVGDAGYFKDPLTAHGITDAFRDAELLARAAADGTPAAWQTYESERDRLSADLFAVTDEIASFEWDLESVRPLHRRLSEAMKAEVAAIAGFAAPGRSLAA